MFCIFFFFSLFNPPALKGDDTPLWRGFVLRVSEKLKRFPSLSCRSWLIRLSLAKNGDWHVSFSGVCHLPSAICWLWSLVFDFHHPILGPKSNP